MSHLHKIISGGQTGADQGALAGARAAGFTTGGIAPEGWLTERGRMEKLLRGYGLEEHHTSGYPSRTFANVKASDGTLIIGNIASRGSAMTQRYCSQLRKPVCCIAWSCYGYGGHEGALTSVAPIGTIMDWILTHQIQVLNVAGNRESGNPGIYGETLLLVKALCKRAKAKTEEPK